MLASLAMLKIGDIFEFLTIVNYNFIFQMLVVFKSAPILKRTLKVKHAMMQLYVLKLLKMQTKYLGRQWRKSNMKTMSAIYTKVRHRLNDDWAYGNGKKFFHTVEKSQKSLICKNKIRFWIWRQKNQKCRENSNINIVSKQQKWINSWHLCFKK